MQAHSFWEELPGWNLIPLFKPRVTRGGFLRSEETRESREQNGCRGLQEWNRFKYFWNSLRGPIKPRSCKNRSFNGTGNCMWRVHLRSIFNQFPNISHYISIFVPDQAWLTSYLNLTALKNCSIFLFAFLKCVWLLNVKNHSLHPLKYLPICVKHRNWGIIFL